MEDIKKLEKVLDTLSNLYEDAAEVDSDCASAINVAEQTIANPIEFLKPAEKKMTEKKDLESMFHFMAKKHSVLIYELENLVGENKKMICTKEIEKLLKKIGDIK